MAGTTSLYGATTIDVYGRVRAAESGDNTIYTAVYTDTGRNLPVSSKVTLTSGKKREIFFTGYDAMGRELTRREETNGAVSASTTRTYTALGHLYTAIDTKPRPPPLAGTDTLTNDTFTYDALGNLLTTNTTGNLGAALSSTSFTHHGTDRDRLCRIDYGPTQTGPCNVTHDGSGNVRTYTGRSGAARNLTYYPSGPVRQIVSGAFTAQLRYDGTGDIDELTAVGSSGIDLRIDKRYGLVKSRSKFAGGVLKTVIERNIPGAGGTVATRIGATGPWVYPISESSGLRYTSDDGADFVQNTKYSPYGVASTTGATPMSEKYVSDQWNGGDFLADFGLVLLGARVYDPQIGRFLSRDPLIIPRSATRLNPYAFAFNDPVNFSDPTGLDPFLSICNSGGFSYDCATGGSFIPEGGANSGWGTALAIGMQVAQMAWDMLQREEESGVVNTLTSFAGAVETIQSYTAPEGWAARGDAAVGEYFAAKKRGDVDGAYVAAKEAEAYYQATAMVGTVYALAGSGGTPRFRLPAFRFNLFRKDPLNHPLFKPGPYARDSIPAPSKSKVFDQSVRQPINKFGRENGCHSCGSKEPGTKSGNFVPDHQPPSALVPDGTPQRLYPHCLTCSSEQGNAVKAALTYLRKIR
jgi:RHS repeat-associated protein